MPGMALVAKDRPLFKTYFQGTQRVMKQTMKS